MTKLTNLHRLNFQNIIVVFLYYIKKNIGIKPSFKEELAKGYYNHIIRSDGYYKGQKDNDFITYYPKWDCEIKIRKKPSSDIIVFSQILEMEEYKPVVNAFKKNFKNHSGLKIIDAGSNIGLTSLYLSCFFDNSEFICIEPDNQNFEVMTFNLKNNKIKKLHSIKGGLWFKSSYLKIIRDFRDQKEWSFRVTETSKETSLEAFSINSLIQKFDFDTIDILKIDIEGSEKEVFTNINSENSFLKITKCIAIEIHDEFNCRNEINTILIEYGFDLFNSGELTIGINKNLIN